VALLRAGMRVSTRHLRRLVRGARVAAHDEVNPDLEPVRPFSITSGPFLGVLRRLHLTRADRTPRALVLVAIAWVPLFVAAGSHWIAGGRAPAILRDLSVHVRLLIAIPLLVLASRMLEQRCGIALAQLYDGDFAPRPQLDGIVDRARRLRGSRLVELGIALVVVLAGQAIAWGVIPRSGLFSGGDTGGASFARIWYAMVSLPIAQFLYFDWLWQWIVWTYVVVRLSRLNLHTVATHPDSAGGIGFLDEPLSAFACFVLAGSTMMAAAWITRVLEHDATAGSFTIDFVCILVVIMVVAVGPLCLFAPMLYRARHRGGPQYDALALDYARDFHGTWVHDRKREQGSADVRSMNDMIGVVGHVKKIRLVPVSQRAIVALWVAAAAPMLPLAAALMPLDELVRKLGDALLAGLPV
jgi:hypothetical protein